MKQILLNEMSAEELRSMIDDSVVAAFLKVKSQEEPKADKLLSRQEEAIFIDVSLPTLNEYTKSGKVIGYIHIFFFSIFCSFFYFNKLRSFDIEKVNNIEISFNSI